MIVVFSPGGCIKNRSTKVFKMAVILDGRQNSKLFRTESLLYLSWIKLRLSFSNVDIFIFQFMR